MQKLFLYFIACILIYPNAGYTSEYDETWLYPEYKIAHISPTGIGIGSSDKHSLKTENLLFISEQPFKSFNEIEPAVYGNIFNKKQFRITYQKPEHSRKNTVFITRNSKKITVTYVPYKSYAEVAADYDEKHGYPRCDNKISEQGYSRQFYEPTRPKTIQPCRRRSERTEDEIEEIRNMQPKTRDIKVTLGASTVTVKERLSYDSVGSESSTINDIEYIDGKIWVMSFYSGDKNAFLDPVRIYDLKNGKLLKEVHGISGWPANIVSDPYRPIVWVASRGSVYSINKNTYEISTYHTSIILDEQKNKPTIILSKDKGVIDPLAIISYEMDKTLRKDFVKAAKTINKEVRNNFRLTLFYMGLEHEYFPRELNILKPFFIKMDKITQKKNKNEKYSYNLWTKVLLAYDEKQQLLMDKQQLFLAKFIRFGLDPPLNELTSSNEAREIILRRFGEPERIEEVYGEDKHKPDKTNRHLKYIYNGINIKLFGIKESKQTWLDRVVLKNKKQLLLGNLKIGDHFDQFIEKLGRANYRDGSYLEYKIEESPDIYTGILYVGIHFEKRLATEIIWSTSPIYE